MRSYQQQGCNFFFFGSLDDLLFSPCQYMAAVIAAGLALDGDDSLNGIGRVSNDDRPPFLDTFEEETPNCCASRQQDCNRLHGIKQRVVGSHSPTYR